MEKMERKIDLNQPYDLTKEDIKRACDNGTLEEIIDALKPDQIQFITKFTPSIINHLAARDFVQYFTPDQIRVISNKKPELICDLVLHLTPAQISHISIIKPELICDLIPLLVQNPQLVKALNVICFDPQTIDSLIENGCVPLLSPAQFKYISNKKHELICDLIPLFSDQNPQLVHGLEKSQFDRQIIDSLIKNGCVPFLSPKQINYISKTNLELICALIPHLDQDLELVQALDVNCFNPQTIVLLIQNGCIPLLLPDQINYISNTMPELICTLVPHLTPAQIDANFMQNHINNSDFSQATKWKIKGYIKSTLQNANQTQQPSKPLQELRD